MNTKHLEVVFKRRYQLVRVGKWSFVVMQFHPAHRNPPRFVIGIADKGCIADQIVFFRWWRAWLR